jgi:DnaJ-class molecular chaperone
VVIDVYDTQDLGRKETYRRVNEELIMSKDYYRTLDVLDDAEDIVIKAVYRALAQRYHPDKWAGDTEEATRRMSDINEAYGVLSDPIKRKQYDSTRDKNSYQSQTSKESDEAQNKSCNKFRENSSNTPFKIKEIKRPRPGKKYF